MDRGLVKQKLRTFICGELMGDAGYALGDDEAIFSGGLIDSYCLANVGVFVELEFAVYIPDAELAAEGFDSLEQMATRILRDLPG